MGIPRPTLNPLQNEQLRNYVDAVIEVRKLKDNPPSPTDIVMGGVRAEHAATYWERRADAEEHARNMYHAFVSSLEWAADSASEARRG